MEEAYKEAQLALKEEDVPVGAVLVEGKEIIARGYNQREKDSDPSAHAEIVVLRKAAKEKSSWRLNSCVLYTTLEPCVMCAGAMVQARIARVVYACADTKGGVISLGIPILQNPLLNHRLEVERLKGAIQEKCSTLLRDFFQERRRKV